MEYRAFCNTDISFFELEKLKQEVLILPVKNIVIILSESACKRWNLHSMIRAINENYDLVWIKDYSSNPTKKDICNALRQMKNFSPELIVAIGGGSAIDLAKGISAIYDGRGSKIYTEQAVIKNIEDGLYKTKTNFIDIIAVPTTAGTGSEVTQWATIWDYDSGKKYSIDHIALKPKMAWIVTELTMTLPKKIVLSTALDALAHAMEAYWSIHSNVLVQDIALRAIDIIVNHLNEALNDLKNDKNRELLCRASLLSGIAFSQTRTTACHSISYPLTLKYGIDHGFAVAMTLAEVAEYNKSKIKMSKLLFDLFEKYGGIKSWLDEVCYGIVELKLHSFGVKEFDLNQIVDHAFTSGRMDNNPVLLSRQDVLEILRKVF